MSVRSAGLLIYMFRDSGRTRQFPEIDKGEWFGIARAKKKILKGQAQFLDIPVEKLDTGSSPA